jgi:hypothetical protein
MSGSVEVTKVTAPLYQSEYRPMSHEMFEAIVEARVEKIKHTLLAKGKEYGVGGDRLHNFRKGQLMAGKPITMAQLLKGFKLKHDISLDDMIEGDVEVTEYLINEKIGDELCYLLLMEAVMRSEWQLLPTLPSYEIIDQPSVKVVLKSSARSCAKPKSKR